MLSFFFIHLNIIFFTFLLLLLFPKFDTFYRPTNAQNSSALSSSNNTQISFAHTFTNRKDLNFYYLDPFRLFLKCILLQLKIKKKRYDEEGVRWVKNIQNSMRYELKHPKLYERERENWMV